MRNIKRKFRIRTKPVIKDAVQLYEDAKRVAPNATQETVVHFMLTNGGNPTPDFIDRVQVLPFAYLRFVRQVKISITDPGYAEGFYKQTGTVLHIPPGDEKAWAKKIATAILIQPTKEST